MVGYSGTKLLKLAQRAALVAARGIVCGGSAPCRQGGSAQPREGQRC